LSDDWLLTDDATDWPALADERRRQRLANPTLDARAVLYGEPLLRFVAERCFATFGSERGMESGGSAADEKQAPPASSLEAPERGDASDRLDYADPAYQRDYDLIREIHAAWLMTPREELRGQTPRQVMISKRHFVDINLQYREHQWSFIGECPPSLDPGSAAYRLAGFGTHEMVVYHDLVRELIWDCRREVAKRVEGSKAADVTREDFLSNEVSRLARRREEWLDAPYSDLGGRTARSVIHNERAQIPEGEDGSHAPLDDDCPLCEAEADLPGPMFWHLDGSHLDDDFAFSTSHETYEEWEQERRRWDDFNRRFNAKQAEDERLGVKFPGHGYTDPDILWKMSFSTAHAEGDPLAMRLFVIGSALSELILDLREPVPDVAPTQSAPSASGTLGHGDLIGRLTHAFRGLSNAVRLAEPEKADAVIRFVLVELRDTLDAVRTVRPDLALKSVELRDRLQRFLEPPSATVDPFDDLFDDSCTPS